MKQIFRILLPTVLTFFFWGCGETQTTSSNPGTTAEGIPNLTLGTPNTAITEGENAVITIVLNRALPYSANLIWEVIIGTTRFAGATGALVVNAGTTSTLLSIPTLDNVVYDGSVKAHIRIRDTAGILSPVEINFDVTDNDPIPFVSIADQQGVRGSRIDLAIELSAASNLETVVGWKTIDATAIAGTDYIAANGTVRIPAGATQAVIGVTTLPLASDSNFTVKLISVENAAFADSSASAHILPGNNLGTKVSFAASTSTLNEAAVNADVVLQLTNAVGVDVVIDLSVEGDAIAGSDYVTFPTTVTIPAGASNVTLPIQILDDAIFEREEILRLRLQSSTNASFGLETVHTIYIGDTDANPTISISDAQALEANALTFSVSLSQVSGADTAFSYLTADGSAGMSDYVQVAGTVTIPRGQTVAQVSVPTSTDTLHEETEDMSLVLSEANGATLLRAVARGSILDDDVAPAVQFSSASQTIGSGVSAVSVPISLSFVSGAAVKIPFTVAGTAVGGLDHNLASGVITIAAGQTTGTISFTIIRHGPPAKTAIITMGTPTGASLGAQTSHTVTF